VASNEAEDNKQYCKAWYRKLRADPSKWQEFLDKRAAYKRGRRLGGKSAATLTDGSLGKWAEKMMGEYFTHEFWSDTGGP
jgi:hypothetical protein